MNVHYKSLLTVTMAMMMGVSTVAEPIWEVNGKFGFGTDTPSTKVRVYESDGGSTSGLAVGSSKGAVNFWGGTVSGVVMDVTKGGVNSGEPIELYLRQGGVNRLIIDTAGRTVIGNMALSRMPAYGRLIVSQPGNAITDGFAVVGTKTHSLRLYVDGDGMRHVAAGKTNVINFNSQGLVAIGTDKLNPNYRLTVDGKVIAKGFTHKTDIWADFVFDPNYRLMPLPELEAFVKARRHLPGLPSEAQVMANGNDMSRTQVLLLQKVEELTLYVIQQQKEIDALKAQIQN